jgi:hypothetical protein
MLWLITHSVYLPLGILLLALIIDIYLTDYFMSKNFFSTNKSKSLPDISEKSISEELPEELQDNIL